jgi:hypothetical protein
LSFITNFSAAAAGFCIAALASTFVNEYVTSPSLPALSTKQRSEGCGQMHAPLPCLTLASAMHFCCSIMQLLAQAEKGTEHIDLSSKVEIAPVVIPPTMPLQFIYNIMQEQGLNYVPVIRQHGPLEGMVTRYAGACVGTAKLLTCCTVSTQNMVRIMIAANFICLNF